jgi:hypothetical protein
MVYGRVYSIRSHQTTDIYIGSTTQILCKRMADHRAGYKQYIKKNKKYHYITSFEILKHADAYIELIYEEEFESKNALAKKEGDYIRQLDCVNKKIEGRTKQEYKEDNKEYFVEKKKQYQIENKEKIAEYQKQHYEDNKEQRLEDAKNYRDEHKEQINEKRKQKYTCKCGSILCKLDKARHERSKKHLEFLNITV